VKPWSESDLNWYLESLASDDTDKISLALFQASDLGRGPEPEPMPTGNAKIVTYLEQLIKDKRLCPVNWLIPHAWGELRWLAGRVLACEYAYQDIEIPIILKDVIQPRKDFDLSRVNLSIEELVQRGWLTRKTEIIKPQDYAYCCSKEAVEKRKREQDSDE